MIDVVAREAAQLAAGSITVFIETDKFKPEPQYANSVTLTITLKSDNTIELRDLALSGLVEVFRSGFRYRRAGGRRRINAERKAKAWKRREEIKELIGNHSIRVPSASR